MAGGFRATLRPRDARGDAAGPRRCGGCTLCCTVLRVDSLRKRGGVPCPELRDAPPGCGIHPERPAICRRYRCLWLQGGLEEADRPDRLGAVLDLLTEAGTTHLAIREAEPGATDRSPRLRAIAERYRGFMPVRITDVADVLDREAPVRLLLPGGEERIVAGDRLTVLRDGRPPERQLLPFGQRMARRALQAWHAWRMRGWS